MFSSELMLKAEELVRSCRARNLLITSAESCTGGLVGGLITSIPGSSSVYERGFITYSNEAKRDSLGVAEALLARHGAVSREVACAMAEGALTQSRAQIAVSITGIAGPGGGSVEKPVGLVHFACGPASGIKALEKRFGDLGRSEIRLLSVAVALDLLLAAAHVTP